MDTSTRGARGGATGFSIAELLVSVIIAAIAFAALVPVFVQAQKSQSFDRVRVTAMSVAQDRIEKIRELDYDLITAENLSRPSDTATWLYASEFGPTWTSDGGRVYQVSYAVDEIANAQSDLPYKRVTVRVDWSPPPAQTAGATGTGVELRTFIYQQYAGPQIVDLSFLPAPVVPEPEESGQLNPQLLTWSEASSGPLILRIAALVNPWDATGVSFVKFAGYGAGNDLVLDEGHVQAVGGQYFVDWAPRTDGSDDGVYRFEATAYSTLGGYAGNTYSEELRLESGPPAAPTGLAAQPGDSVVNLTWAEASRDVVGYEIWKWQGAEAPARVGDQSIPDNAWKDTAVVNGTTYSYYVVAVDWRGGRSLASIAVQATPGESADTTSPPTPLVTSTPTAKKAVLSWLDVADTPVGGLPTSGTSHYWVYRDDGQAVRVESPKLPGASVGFAEDISADHTYTVTSVDLVGNESATSAPVSVRHTVPSWTLTVTSNKVADLTVRDSTGKQVGFKANSKLLVLTLEEGTYYVSALRGVTPQGPVPQVLDRDGVVVNFTF
jgi:type II secretory pathway pseudopilin PulG